MTPSSSLVRSAEFPEKMQCLFQPKRYKVLWGGRGSGRSWGCASALALIGAKPELMQRSEGIRVLCARELQKSIADSVHQLLSDRIYELGLGLHYNIQNQYIYGPQGTVFSFEGIKNNTSKIKSYEGIDICWVEEAIKVSKSSWNVLIPTIRKEMSEIWMTFNPELETDYTYDHFVLNADAAMSFVVKMTWKDNPWFPQTLMREMELLKRTDYDAYLNVWEGFCLQVLEGAVYAKEMRRCQEEGRICEVPWDREWPVDVVFDLGRANNTACWFVQRVAMQTRVLAYEEHSGEDWAFFLKLLKEKRYVIGTIWLPHDAKAKVLGSKRTIEEQTRAAFSSVQIVPKLSLTDGINAGRIALGSAWFDQQACTDGLKALRHYSYAKVDGQLSNEPLHNWASDGADAWRYLAIAMGLAKTRSGRGSRADRILGRLAAAVRGHDPEELREWMRR